MKILHIENERAATRRLHAEWLAKHGSNITLCAATTLEEAVKRLGQETVDGVVLDLALPDSRGLATCSRLCTAFPELPVVAVSANDAEEEAVQAIRLGVQDCVCLVDLSGQHLARRLAFAVERKKYAYQDWQQTPVACGSKIGVSETAAASGNTTPTLGQVAEAARSQAPIMEALGSPERPIRVLYVQQGSDVMREMREAARQLPPSRFFMHTCDRLSTAFDDMAAGAYDVVLIEWGEISRDGLEEINACRRQGRVRCPLLVIANPVDDSTAVSIIQHGAHDLVSPRLSTRVLVRTIRLALERQLYSTSCRLPQFSPQANRSPVDQAPRQSHLEMRRDIRYLLTRPVYAVPVLPGHMPDVNRLLEGFSVDLSVSGMAFTVSQSEAMQYRRFVVGIEPSQGAPQFAMAEICHMSGCDGQLRVGVEFASHGQDLFRDNNLLPALDSNSYRFHTGLSPEALNQWQEIGVLRPFLLDRVYGCPNCGALPSLRRGCRACGSGRLVGSQLIHHFTCAYVGFVAEFEGAHEMVCPKCRTRKLVVGADFEYLPGPASCIDCGWSGTDAEQVAHCCRCNQRFPLHQAAEVELTGYHVNRLDPLALIGSS